MLANRNPAVASALSRPMRVRIWIQGADGPSRDFELLTAPQIGDRIAISLAGATEEGVVAAVTWQLQAMDATGADLGLDAEPVGSVSMVHVICRPRAEVVQINAAVADVDAAEAGGAA